MKKAPVNRLSVLRAVTPDRQESLGQTAGGEEMGFLDKLKSKCHYCGSRDVEDLTVCWKPIGGIPYHVYFKRIVERGSKA